MSENENQQQQQEQQLPQQESAEQKTDAAGNALRGRGGDLIGMDRGPIRGGRFDALQGPMLEASPQGASSSVEGWVVMLSNLSPSTSENDLRLLLADVDPTGDIMGEGGNTDTNNNDSAFIVDLRMNPSAATCGCVGHAFVKVPKLEYAHLVQKLNGRSFVDDLPVRVDFVFAVPEVESGMDGDGAADVVSTALSGKQRGDRGDEDNAGAMMVKPGREEE